MYRRNSIFVLMLCMNLCITATPPLAYVVSQGTGELVVINTQTNEIIEAIPVLYANFLTAIAITPNNQFAYIINAGGTPELIVMNITNNSYVTSIGVSGPSPEALAITPDGKYVLVINFSNSGANFVDVIATATNTKVFSQVVGTHGGSPLATPLNIAISPDGNNAYIGDNASAQLRSYDLTSLPTFPLPVQWSPLVGSTDGNNAAVVTSDSNTVYVVNQNTADIYVITNLQGTPSVSAGTSVQGAGPVYIILTPDNQTAYVVNQTGSVSIMDLTTPLPTFVTNIPTGGLLAQYAAITPDGLFVYVTDEDGNNVTVISTASRTLLTTIDFSAYSQPLGIAIVPGTPSPPPVPTLASPTNVGGTLTCNVFLTQTDLINKITWSAPTSGETPVAYSIYRDSLLTQLITSVPETGPLLFYDHNRKPCTTYTYYIVSVDAYGNMSLPTAVTITA